MGFWDSLEELADLAFDIATAPIQLAEIIWDSGNDIAEATVQGIKNTLNGEGDEDIRTSYDIKEEAEKRISTINGKHYDAVNDFDKLWKNMTAHMNYVNKRRERVYWMLGMALHNTSLAPLPTTSSLLVQRPSPPSIDSFSFGLGSFLGSTSLRMEAAKEYELKSKEYEAKVKSAISKIHQTERRVTAFKHSLEEEDTMLKAIEDTYLQQSEGVMAQTARILRSIANECVNTMNDTTQKRYNELLNQLRRLWA